MHKILLYRNGAKIMGSTGLMNVDGRFGMERVKHAIRERNKQLEKNFPNEVCEEFVFCDKRLNETSQLYKL